MEVFLPWLLCLLVEEERGKQSAEGFRIILVDWKLPLAYRGLLWESYNFSGLGFSTQFVIYHKMFAISWRFLYPYYFTF